ncbi:MAG: amidohydrolase [Bacteroidota bacterium]
MNSDILKLTIVQTDIEWEDVSANLNRYSDKLALTKGKADLIILPEMFSTGFTMNVDKVGQSPDGEIVSWMKSTSLELQTAVLGSVIIKEGNSYFNRAYFFYPDGSFEYYDKKHLFTLAGEEKVFSPGNERKVFEYKGWKIMPLVCYDLRFPVWSRNDLNYDLLIYIASWPDKRRFAWQNLLKARAIENMAYVAGVNRVGLNVKGFDYSGDSAVLNSLGESIFEAKEYEEEVEIVEISKSQLVKTRKVLGFINDIDDFRIG